MEKMARLNILSSTSTTARKNRYFSEELKQKLVREIEQNLITIAEVSREYQVRRWAIYKWIQKYSSMRKKAVKMVVESKSLTKQLTGLKAKIKELEQLVGQKQITIEYLEKMIELAEQDMGIDIKKKGRK
jgi:transposase-like protein